METSDKICLTAVSTKAFNVGNSEDYFSACVLRVGLPSYLPTYLPRSTTNQDCFIKSTDLNFL